jgi:hypothetical protein
MALQLSALCADQLSPQEDSWYPFLLAAESIQDHSAARKTKLIENEMTSSETETVTFRLVA